MIRPTDVGFGDSCQPGDKDRARFEEQTHIEDAGKGEKQAAEDADAPAEPFFRRIPESSSRPVREAGPTMNPVSPMIRVTMPAMRPM